MKTQALKKYRKKLANQQPVFGLWVTMESPTVTEIAVAMGLDWVTIDAEHGHLDWKEIVEHIRAAARSDTVILVRVTEIQEGLIKRTLDIGADGIVVPWIERVSQLEEALKWAHYPLKGRRGIGAERATAWGQCLAEHVKEAEENVLVVPIIESVKGGKNLKNLLKVKGTEMFFFGPADYSSTAGYAGQWEGPGVAKMILRNKDMMRKAGKHCGVLTQGPEDRDMRLKQGFRMLGVGMDAGLVVKGIQDNLVGIRDNIKISTNLKP